MSTNGIRDWNFFLSFLAYLIKFWEKIMPGRGSTIFRVFLKFVSEFFWPGRVWTEFAMKNFFSLFRLISFPFWLKIMPGRGFIIFWIFLIFFLEFSCRVEYKRNSGLKFFSRFLGPPHPVLAKNYVGKRFFNFLNFFAIFFGIFFPGWEQTEFRTKIFFSRFWPISSSFGKKFCREEVL